MQVNLKDKLFEEKALKKTHNVLPFLLKLMCSHQTKTEDTMLILLDMTIYYQYQCSLLRDKKPN